MSFALVLTRGYPVATGVPDWRPSLQRSQFYFPVFNHTHELIDPPLSNIFATGSHVHFVSIRSSNSTSIRSRRGGDS